MSRQISDDPSVVQPVFQELKSNFFTHKTKPVAFRKAALKRLLEGYTALEPEFNEALRKDLGHNPFVCNFGAHAITKAEISDLLSHVDSWVKPSGVATPVGLGLATCEVEHEPLGVALVISAWNYPIYTAVPQVAAAISAGNCVILKPSELAPETSGVLRRLFEEYMDPRFFRVIEGRVEVAKAVVKLQVDVICFTGSTATGRLVAIEAAKNLVPCVLELGGKCPVIVDETAKLPVAVNRILFGKFLNCGQTCIGVDHVFVHESHREAFRTLLLAKMEEFYGGAQNLEEDGNYGKIINRFHLDRIQKFLKDEHGGKVLYSANAKPDSRFLPPTVVESPRKDSLLMQDEIFGPILPLFYYSDLPALIAEINARPKPLVVYQFSESKANIQLVRKQTASGAFVVNDTIMQMTNLSLPFGGVGASGHGRFHGKDGFLAFTNPKSVALISSMDSYPVNQRYPPYTSSKKATMTKLLKIGFVTYRQIGKVLLIVLLLIALAFAYQHFCPCQKQEAVADL